MRFLRLLSGSVLFCAIFLLAVPMASAATSADACFCYVNDGNNGGATKMTGATNATSCQSLCTAKYGDKSINPPLWTTSFSSYPGANLRCWQKQGDCEKDLDQKAEADGSMTVDGTWSHSQPAECLPGSHYCYAADTAKTTLQVEIAGTTQVINFGEYVGIVYNYLIGFAMTIAIVLLMVGGLRYVLGGASEKSISGAKKMMVDAVEGFVLLMFAYVILYTVNPQLLKLQVPRMPMLRKVTIISGNDCATLMGLPASATPGLITGNSKSAGSEFPSGAKVLSHDSNGVVLKYTGSPECGTTAEILAGIDGAGVADGTTCDFGYCDGDKGCGQISGGNKCISCAEIGPDNTYGAQPSAALCSSLTPANETSTAAGETVMSEYNSCSLTKQPSMFMNTSGYILAAASTGLTGGFPIGLGLYTADVAQATAKGACASLKLTCSEITDCTAYDNKKVFSSIATGGQELDDLNVTWVPGPTIYDICAKNPCGVAGGCEIIENTGFNTDCVAAGEGARRTAAAAAAAAAAVTKYENEAY